MIRQGAWTKYAWLDLPPPLAKYTNHLRYPPQKRLFPKKGLFGLTQGDLPTNHGVHRANLAGTPSPPTDTRYVLTRQKQQFMVYTWVRISEVWRFRPYCDYHGDGRRVCFELIFVSEFTRARLPMRPKNVILLEINIIVTNFNDVDLLYYLFCTTYCSTLLSNSAGYGAPWWWPWNSASRHLVTFYSDLCVFLLPHGPRPQGLFWGG